MATDESGEPMARCSLWWTQVPHLADLRAGLIGHYAATSDEAARVLLQKACEILAGRGCTMAIGPMDGSTWHSYRLVTERNGVPVFFLEPDNPEEWPAHFTQSGFSVLATYSSALNDDLSQRDLRAYEAQKRLEAAGVKIRALRMDDFEGELSRIYRVAEISFRKNFLYTPISEADFLAQYNRTKSVIRPELCLIAEFDNQPVGFIFALPDVLQAARGEAIDTIIIKTLAVLPEHAGVGLGAFLADKCQQTALDLGYQKAIHALMHDANNSLNISSRYARVIRRYALFGRELNEL